MKRYGIILTLLAFLGGCVDVPTRSVTAVPDDIVRFEASKRPLGVNRSNLDLAEDFLDLTFRLENGDRLPRLLKYEGPVRVVLRSQGLSTYLPELRDLLDRLRSESGIDIELTPNPTDAQIHIWAASRAGIARAFPGAACFIVPGVTSWDEFRWPPMLDQFWPARSEIVEWSELERLTVTSIFIPADSTPQDTRDCLHEELAQALGPANDMYRLSDTVFNDDNFHSVLTPFDMLMLRTLYDDRLPAGISREKAAALVPAVLNRINPSGRGLARELRASAAPRWKSAIEAALDRRKRPTARQSAAAQAVAFARQMKPTDHRLGLSLLTLGRITSSENPKDAKELFEAAYVQFADQFGGNSIHLAHVALHLALVALREDEFDRAIALARRHAPAARKAENAVVLSGLLAIESEALLALGDLEKARAARIDSLEWARYAFGDTNGNILKARAKIAAFRPEPSEDRSSR